MGRFIRNSTAETFRKITLFSLILALVYIILGFLMIVFPVKTINAIGYIVGAMFILTAINTLYKYIKRDGAQLYRFNIIFVIMEFIVGILIIFVPGSVASLITLLLGIYLIIFGINKITYGLYFRLGNEPSWPLTLTTGIMLVLFGICLTFNPFSALTLTTLVGVFLMVTGILDLVSTLLIRKRVEEIVTIFW